MRLSKKQAEIILGVCPGSYFRDTVINRLTSVKEGRKQNISDGAYHDIYYALDEYRSPGASQEVDTVFAHFKGIMDGLIRA